MAKPKRKLPRHIGIWILSFHRMERAQPIYRVHMLEL